MTPLNKALAGVLVVQLLATGLTWRPRGGAGGEAVDLLGVTTDAITKITITGRMAKEEVPEDPVVLVKSGDGWILESSEGFPATEKNVKPLLENLDKLHQVKDAIATRTEDHTILEVADDRFTRKVEVVAGGETKTFYFGAAQGQASHVRAAGQADVFDVRGFSAWSLAETDNRYFDREFLKVDPATVQSLTIERPGQPPVQFVQADAGTTPPGGQGPSSRWSITPTPEGKEVDQATTKTFVQSALTVRILEPGPREARPDMGLDGGTKVTWVELDPDAGGAPTTHSYVVGGPVPDESGRLWMKSTTSPWVVKVMKGTVLHALEKPYDPLFTDAAPPTP